MAAGELLQSLGHTVEEAAPGTDYALLNQVQNTLIASGPPGWITLSPK